MASISTTLELVDHISGRLAAIGSRVQALADCFGELDGRISGVQGRMEQLEFRPGEWEFGRIELPRPAAMELPEIGTPELETLYPGLNGLQAVQPARIMWLAPEIQAPELPALRMTAGVDGPEGQSELLHGLAQELMTQGERLSDAAEMSAGAAAEAAARAMDRAQGIQIGADFSGGLAQGIRSGMSSVLAAARSVAAAAASAARSALDIHSPSRVAQQIGAQFGAGFAYGIEDSKDRVTNAAGRLSGVAYRELDGEIWSGLRLFSALERLQLEDDGEIYLSTADVRRMRELAEREAVQSFTTAELNIEFTANNTIDSKLDLDGVVSYLEEQVAEKLALAAEGVYI